jgi:hypothetical protein
MNLTASCFKKKQATKVTIIEGFLHPGPNVPYVMSHFSRNMKTKHSTDQAGLALTFFPE